MKVKGSLSMLDFKSKGVALTSLCTFAKLISE